MIRTIAVDFDRRLPLYILLSPRKWFNGAISDVYEVEQPEGFRTLVNDPNLDFVAIPRPFSE